MNLILRLEQEADERGSEAAWDKSGTCWDAQTAELVAEAAIILKQAADAMDDMRSKINYLLDGGHRWSSDEGYFTFPDGDTWWQPR